MPALCVDGHAGSLQIMWQACDHCLDMIQTYSIQELTSYRQNLLSTKWNKEFDGIISRMQVVG